MIAFDKLVLCQFIKIHGEFGIGLITVPVILVGYAYGPSFGFFFGLLILPFVAGSLEFITWLVSPPLGETAWLPFLPSFSSFIDGIVAFVSGYLRQSLPLVLVVGIGSSIKCFLNIIKHKATSSDPIKFGWIGEIFFNTFLVFFFSNFFQTILSLV